MIDRYDALEALLRDSTLSDSLKAATLVERFAAERFCDTFAHCANSCA